MLLRVVTVKEREIGCDWVCMPRWLLKRKRERERERDCCSVFTLQATTARRMCVGYGELKKERQRVFMLVSICLYLLNKALEREREHLFQR